MAKSRLLHLALFIGLAAVLVPASVHAVTILNEESETSIRENCIDAQQSMQVLQRTDIVARISRGNSYATLQKLMTAMSARAAANAYNVPELTESAGQFSVQKAEFVDMYTDYEINLRSLATMNCQSEPVLFYDRLEAVRDQRQDLSDLVEEMSQEIDSFDQAVEDLKQEVAQRHEDS